MKKATQPKFDFQYLNLIATAVITTLKSLYNIPVTKKKVFVDPDGSALNPINLAFGVRGARKGILNFSFSEVQASRLTDIICTATDEESEITPEKSQLKLTALFHTAMKTMVLLFAREGLAIESDTGLYATNRKDISYTVPANRLAVQFTSDELEFSFLLEYHLE